MASDHHRDVLAQAAQATPSVVAIAVTKLFEISPERWLTYWGIFFLMLQTTFLLLREFRRWRRRERAFADTAPE